MSRGVWVEVPVPPKPADKAAITARCESFVEEVLRPRFFAQITPHPTFNYAVGLRGAWHGTAYRFLQRWRTGTSRQPPEEWEIGFARLRHFRGGRFELAYFRHTDQWWPLGAELSLEEALAEIEYNPLLQPIS
jgi:hypothetical protein